MDSGWSQLAEDAGRGYATVGLLVLIATGLALVILVLTHLIGPKRVGARKQATYESGMEPIGDARRRFNVRFYIIALLFLVFDVEVVFLYPWAVIAPRMHEPGAQGWAEPLAAAGYTPGFLFAAVALFFALLLIGLVYEWRRGVFKWN
jgi:NADH-quinone oxidoreductase subunit A